MSDPIHWTITPLATPVVYRKCARCDERTVFRSSDKFRVNGSGRKLDVGKNDRSRLGERSRYAEILYHRLGTSAITNLGKASDEKNSGKD